MLAGNIQVLLPQVVHGAVTVAPMTAVVKGPGGTLATGLVVG